MASSKSRPLSALPLTPAFVIVVAACGGGQAPPPMIEAHTYNPPARQQLPAALDAGGAALAVDAGPPADVGLVHDNPPPMPAPAVTASPTATPTARGGGRKPTTGPRPLSPG